MRFSRCLRTYAWTARPLRLRRACQCDIVAKTRDGIAYADAGPGTIPIPYVSYSEHPMADGFRIHHLYVKCKDLPPLPREANPREPTINKVVRRMKETLVESPGWFVKFNNGITLICSHVGKPSGGSVPVTFEPGMGICNGGHTYLAIQNSKTADHAALVHLELIELPPAVAAAADGSIVQIAEARNNNTQLKDISQADQLDYYETIKGYMADTTMVVWHEGDSRAKPHAVSAIYLVRLLKALDPLRFKSLYAKGKPGHADASRAGKKLHSEWMKDMAGWKADPEDLEGDDDEEEG